MNIIRGALFAILLAAQPWAAMAQDTAQPAAIVETRTAPPAMGSTTVPSTTVQIPAGTLIVLEFTEGLSSRANTLGQLFGLRLAEPIVVNGEIAVPAGILGGGEVIDAHRSGMGGRQGVLNVSGRYIEVGGQRVRIRGMQVLAAGEDNTREAVNTAIIVGGAVGATIGILIQGGEVEIPVGTRANARIATAFDAPWPPVQILPAEADGQATTSDTIASVESDTTAPVESDTVASTEGEAPQ